MTAVEPPAIPDPPPESGSESEPTSSEAAPAEVAVEVAAPERRSSARSVGAWLVLLGVAVALDGLAGGLAAVVVAAVALARAPWRVLGLAGVVALAAVPAVVLGQGLPTIDDVSPTFVSRSLVPHHLMFAGLVWVATWAVLDLRPHLIDAGAGIDVEESSAPPSRGRRVAGLVLVAAVAVGAVAASVAVLQT